MSLQRINYAAHEDQVVAATPDQLRADLDHPVIGVYVYVGKATDPGGKAAARAGGLLQPEYNIYFASSMDDLREWVPAGQAGGIVFGRDAQPDALLTEAEASITDVVVDALMEAP
jgi:hypothetical protein